MTRKEAMTIVIRAVEKYAHLLERRKYPPGSDFETLAPHEQRFAEDLNTALSIIKQRTKGE